MLVTLAPVVCWPWHLRTGADTSVRGAECRYCRRDVALPTDQRGIPCCLYCALDRGFVPADEASPY